MPDLYFNKESGYSEENTSDGEEFRPTILQSFQFEPEQKKTCANESHEKRTKRIYASAFDLLHIRIVNLNWCKCRHCKNEAGGIDCLCCREVDAIHFISAKISEHKISILPSSFSGQLPDL